MNDFLSVRTVPGGSWCWPVELEKYDRSPTLTAPESEALAVICHRYQANKYPRIPPLSQHALTRLLTPVEDALMWAEATEENVTRVLFAIVAKMGRDQAVFWAWSEDEWYRFVATGGDFPSRVYKRVSSYRHDLLTVAYLLCGFADFSAANLFKTYRFAVKVFGQPLVEEAVNRTQEAMRSWGYHSSNLEVELPRLIAKLLLANYSPYLDDLTSEVVRLVYERNVPESARELYVALSRILASLGLIDKALLTERRRKIPKAQTADSIPGVSAEWVVWCRRWYNTATVSLKYRNAVFNRLMMVGRWLKEKHPEITSPEQWTRDVALEYLKKVEQMKVGDYAAKENVHTGRVGMPLNPRTRFHRISSLRTFLEDCQQWEWIARRFNPARYLATPQPILSLIGPNPRVIKEDIWAKLLWAGLNLTEADLPAQHERPEEGRCFYYPLEMVRAVVIVWLFCGLRQNEVRRLRLGCIRWQYEDVVVPSTGEIVPKNAVCFLDVPVTKTSTTRTIPVDHLVGEVIAEWEKIRPAQPPRMDRKTGELVNFLFLYRGRPIGEGYINLTVIPMLCQKAGVPREDARGRITSHRARSTIASQLFNAKNPMSLFEIQQWLGHRSPETTQNYVRVAPTKLAGSFLKADYFRQNLRTIEVLIDLDVIKNGQAANGEPWKFYDLGHGYCTYDFFDQCPHCMACAKCAFYVPKHSSKAQILEAKANLQKMLQEIPLADEERAAVEDGVTAMEKLCERLADVPTPAGPTPRQLTATKQIIVPLISSSS